MLLTHQINFSDCFTIHCQASVMNDAQNPLLLPDILLLASEYFNNRKSIHGVPYLERLILHEDLVSVRA